ncbi:Uncharacterized protein APZ42_003500 [Daphnia magna]|uniref:Uncharacterized protein n=1 Tax=Daphnia magna TaxID=35525 RepID=A0A164HI74_9CRUS|nr:Uncharacterized protein APZ42_003500 [Daphnia magna]
MFLKSKALSGTVYIAQVLPCNKKIADQISKAVMKFLWMRKEKRPKKPAIFRTVKEGGLGMVKTPVLPFPFPLPLLQSPDRAQQSRKLSTSLLDVLSSPNLIATLQGQHHTCSSHEETVLPSGTPASNQATFRIFHSGAGESNGSSKNDNYWILEETTMGKLEILRPNLDWPRIWKETAALPTNIRETMFLLNIQFLSS